MKFYSTRELRSTSTVWNELAENGQAIITNNGKPKAILLDVSEDNYEETLSAINQAKAMIAFNSMRAKSMKNGFMSEEEIENEIAAARRGE